RIIADSAFKYQQEVEQKQRIIVGLNEFIEEDEEEVEIRESDPDFEKNKIAGLRKLKDGRNPDEVKAGLDQIAEVLQSTDNVMPVLIKAVKANITLGEIVNVMRGAFGEFREDPIY
ncbi:MAG: methylmalonyl-CoA mutase, partial [Deltaproteobacteria bacterium]|nr:methylmalonyl-CoA mutase [Deltaproteobacteria bacterium]